ncbi:phosphoribosyltransferase [Candidatus Bathyarchaeota archaeon]|nr:MAG: phosphoribosyltransferase [Candidatus Bathyarchaeota archaeon]
MLLNLADKIRRDGFNPDIIVGVSRGGWPPARIMSDLLDNQELANVRVEFYVDIAKTMREPVITQSLSVSVEGKRVLVMDDVADTGMSLRLVKSHVEERGAREIKTATIYYKPWSVIKPEYYERETRKWVIFPWERKETVRKVLQRCRREGIPIEEARRKLVEGGLDPNLVERFINDVLNEGKPPHGGEDSQ